MTTKDLIDLNPSEIHIQMYDGTWEIWHKAWNKHGNYAEYTTGKKGLYWKTMYARTIDAQPYVKFK